ncbi:MAG TPA: DMT family transporter [Burkholderiales bacterium]|nr:DMT family transporter [Burkholderiales bacterium]
MRHAPYAALLAAAALWGANPVLGRLVGSEIPPITLSWLRWVLVLCALTPLVWRQRRALAHTARRHWRILLPLALLANVPQSALVYKGLETTAAVNVGLLNSTIPVLIVLLGALFFARRIVPREIAGILLSLTGVLVMLFQGSSERLLSLSLDRGDLYAFGGMLTWALYTLLLPRRPPMPLLGFVACMSAFGVVLGAPAALAEVLLDRAPAFSAQTLTIVAFIALGPTLAGTVAYSYGAERAGPVHAGICIHFMPVFASLLAITVLHERVHAYHFAGFALVLAGALLALRSTPLLSSRPSAVSAR